jgi:hypothetical protein
MDFLNHREGGMFFYQVFHLSPSQCSCNCRNCKRLREFEEMEILRQSCGDDFEYQEDFAQEFGLRSLHQSTCSKHQVP